MIELREFITRNCVRGEPGKLFVFGDNLVRRGMAGQAAAMRGEPNAVGIPTKRLPSMKEEAFFTDADLDEWRRAAAPDIARLIAHDGVIVWPSYGIGTGMAQLEKRAPAIWAEITALYKSLIQPSAG